MKWLLRKMGITVGILGGILVGIGAVLYIIMPKSPKPPAKLANVGELETYLERVVAAERPPGLSVAVVKNGEIVYANGFGVANAQGDVAVTEETVYHWWSMTKVITAVSIMQLHEQGYLNIDHPISTYLPYFSVTHHDEDATVTIRQILNHSAGMSNATPEIFTWVHLEGDPPVNQSDFVASKFADYDELRFAPGTKTDYSNWGYTVLGALIEAVAGQTYESYVVDNILQPLAMHNSHFVYTETMAAHEATGSQHLVDLYTPFFPLLNLTYIIEERVGMRFWFHRVYNDQTAPSGLIGSAADVGRFMTAYLSADSRLLQPESFATMNEAITQVQHPSKPVRGLGWEAHVTENGRFYLTHSGGGPGFATIMRVYPDEQLGIVVMGNDSTMDRDGLADVLANMEW